MDGTAVAPGLLMKKTTIAVCWMAGALAVSGCSTVRGGKSGQQLSSTGPTIVSVDTRPGTFELNEALQPTQDSEVVAQIKDFTSEISEVKLQFVNVPMEIPMDHVGGTTWRAVLTPEQLRSLAVAGETMNYDANVIARNEDGLSTVSADPVEIEVRAPERVTG